MVKYSSCKTNEVINQILNLEKADEETKFTVFNIGLINNHN